MAFNPGDPQIIYMVNSTRIYKSVNGGYIWTQVTTGLPTTSIQRIKLGVTPANVNFVYAIYSNSSSGYLGTYLSTNNGDTWTSKSTTPNILGWSPTGSDTGGQGWYDLAIACSQTNPDLLYIGGINVWYSTNGGSTWTYFNNNMHVDIHHLYFIPGTDILYCGNDGGIYRKNTGVNTWTWLGASLPTTQYYCIGTSETNGSMIMGGAQDNGTKLYTSSTVAMVYGGDGMECAIDPTNSSIMYACYQSGGLGRSTNGGTSFTSIAPSTSGAWVTPYMLNPQRLKQYGLDLDGYNALRKKQKYCCVVCKKHEEDISQGRAKTPATALHVDHDHVTGKVRGLLCTNCNIILGKCYDDAKILEQAIKYLKDTL
jgi:hypothetical protein